MRQTLAGVLLLATAALADLPVHCLHGDIAGDWTLHISKPIGASFPNCSAPYETAATIRVRLNKGGAARVLGASENAATVLAAGAVTPGAGGPWATRRRGSRPRPPARAPAGMWKRWRRLA